MQIILDFITALGSVATFGAFIFLFRRDKDKQIQIDKLSNIALVMEAQNDLIKKQNDLIGQQVDIFRNTSLLKGNDRDALNKLSLIEEKKLRLSVQPVLWTNGGGYSGYNGEFSIDLNNKGETAIIQQILNNSNDVLLHNHSLSYEIEMGSSYKIRGRQKGEKHIQHCSIDIDILYKDRAGNNYKSKIQGIGMHIKISETLEL